MTLMLSFAWRQQRASFTSSSSSRAASAVASKDDQSDFTSSPVPEVTTSASGETNVSHCLYHDDGPTNTTTLTRQGRFEYGKITPPPTPEGLRPRKSIDQIREELCLPPQVLGSVNWLPPRFPTITNTTWQADDAPPQDDIASYMSIGNTSAQMIMSPQISTSSFYSRSTSSRSRVAESPNLQVGHAKTAVGALIAMGQVKQQQQVPSGMPSSLQPSLASMAANIMSYHHQQPQDPYSCMDVLPPRTWIPEEDQVDDEGSNASDADMPYQALHETTPTRRRRRTSVQNQSPESASTMTTVTSSNHASPSSNYNWRRTHEREDQGVNVSFSSQIELIAADQRRAALAKPNAYNFDSILAEHEVTDFVVESDQATSVSAISQSTKDQYEPDQQWQVSRPEEDDFYYQYGGEDVMEKALRRRKNQHNRQTKEQLLLAVLERLQDDRQLVTDLQAARGPTDHMSEWLVTTNLNEEGLLTGFSPSKRSAVIRQLDSILNEMRVAQPEDFFMSPSQMQGFAETHSNLHQALVFVRTLVLLAIPEMEKNKKNDSGLTCYQGRKWKCRPGFRSALGIDEVPQSPDTVRGGDTSVFSLPSDDNTPHASNVSLTTTITSYTSPLRPGRSNVTNIRPTLETISSLLHKLSHSCHDLTDSSKALRAADQLKRTYLKLVAIQVSDMRALLDAFELEYLPPLRITRQVSEDEEAVAITGNDRAPLHQGAWPIMTTTTSRWTTSLPLPPPSLHRSTILPPPLPAMILPPPPPPPSDSINYNNSRREYGASTIIRSKPVEQHDDSMLSFPHTDDMTSLPSSSSSQQPSRGGAVWVIASEEDHNDPEEESEGDYDYVDDLRRQVGSNDYDDNGDDHDREGPEVVDDDDDDDDEPRCAVI